MFKKTALDNGIPVLFEKIEGFRSVVMGIWIKVGSRFEPTDKNGISHFIEHMAFKGTKKRTAEDIAIEIDTIGADLNAFTTRENTAFYVRVIDEYLEKGMDILCDIFSNSVFDASEIQKEKMVIEEEIKLSEDTPDDHIFDLFNMNVWGKEGLGQSILGSEATIKTFARDDLMKYIGSFYTKDNIVISCAGNMNIDKTVDILNKKLQCSQERSEHLKITQPLFRSSKCEYEKDLSEVHMCLGFEGIPSQSDERYALLIINTLFGAGVSSRLFQEVREKKGLVYSIHSFVSTYYDTGCIGVYAGSSSHKYREVHEIIVRQAGSLKNTLTEDELFRTKNQLKSTILLALESTSSRMNNIAKQEIYYGKYFAPDEIIRNIEKVNLNEVRGLSERIFNTDKMAVTLLGPVKEE